MPNTKITKKKWKDHWSYAKKVYILGMIVAAAAANLAFSVTRYSPPAERAVLIELVDSYVDTVKLDDVKAELLIQAQEFDPTLEEVSFMSIAYSGDAGADYYGAQAYMVQVYAGENDIYLVNDMLLGDLVAQGYCAPLELMEGYDAFMRKHPEIEPVWLDEPVEDEEEYDDATPAEPRPRHVYALNASTLNGMVTRGAYAVRDKFALLSMTSTNIETSFHVLTLMYDMLSEAPPATPSEAGGA